MARLAAGDAQAAWDDFHGRYRPLILAVIGRLVVDREEQIELHAIVCAALIADDFARLRRCARGTDGPRRTGAWLVAVTRNQTIDWLRRRDGRRRVAVAPNLPPLQRSIHAALCRDRLSPAEAYEVLRARDGYREPFGAFLREVRAVRRTAPCPELPSARSQGTPGSAEIELTVLPQDTLDVEAIADLLQNEPDDVRVAIRLFVGEGVPAAEVARIVGWHDAKAVYNRVNRALARLRETLQRRGLGPDDFR